MLEGGMIGVLAGILLALRREVLKMLSSLIARDK
jgi:hypothetical protein